MKKLLFSTRNFNNDLALLVIRVTFGTLLLVNHGIGKINKLMNPPVKFMDFMGIGPTASLWLVVFAEVGCSLLIIFGLATRFACMVLMFTFVVIVFVTHAGDPLKEVESAVVYLGVFLALFISGPGNYSMDKQALRS